MSMLERISAQLILIEQRLKNDLGEPGLSSLSASLLDRKRIYQEDSANSSSTEKSVTVGEQHSEQRTNTVEACVKILHQSIQRLGVLSEITNEVKGKHLLQDVVAATLDAINRRTPLSFSVLILGERELGPYQYHGMRGEPAPWRYLLRECPFPLSGSLAQAILRRRQPDEPDYLLYPDLSKDGPTPEEFQWLSSEGSLLFLPMRFANSTIGVLMLGRSKPNGFADETLCQDLYDICSISAEAIRTAQMHQEVSSNAEKLVNAQLLTREIALVQDYQELITILTDRLSEIAGKVSVNVYIEPSLHHLGSDRHAPIYLPNVDTKLQLVSTDLSEVDSLFSPQTENESRLITDLLEWAIDAGQPLFYDPWLIQSQIQHPFYNESGAAMIVPISDRLQTYGALHLTVKNPHRRFDEPDMVVLRTIANSAAIAFAKIQILREKQNSLLSALHPLVGVVESRFAALNGHSERTAHNAALLAKSMGLPSELCMQIRIITSFHEIGMASLPDAALEMQLLPQSELVPITTADTLLSSHEILTRSEIDLKITQLLTYLIRYWNDMNELPWMAPWPSAQRDECFPTDSFEYPAAAMNSLMDETQELDSVVYSRLHKNHRNYDLFTALSRAELEDDSGSVSDGEMGSDASSTSDGEALQPAFEDGDQGNPAPQDLPLFDSDPLDSSPLDPGLLDPGLSDTNSLEADALRELFNVGAIHDGNSSTDTLFRTDNLQEAAVQIIALAHALDEFLVRTQSHCDLELATAFLHQAPTQTFEKQLIKTFHSLVEQELVLLPST